jgi:hypothetical protein
MHDKNAPGRRPRLRRGACHVRIEAIELRDFGGELPRIFRESAGDRLLVVVLTSSSALPPPSRLLSGFAVPLRESAAFIRLRSREIAIAATCSRPYPANNARGPRRPRLPVITPVSVNNIVSFWITLDQMPPSLGLVLAVAARCGSPCPANNARRSGRCYCRRQVNHRNGQKYEEGDLELVRCNHPHHIYRSHSAP